MNTQPSTSTPSYDESDLVDWEEIFDRLDHNIEIIARIAVGFQKKAPKLLENIVRAVEQQDSWELFENAHSLKGAISIFSTKAPYELAGKLERIGKEDRLEDTREILIELKQELDSLSQELSDFVART